MAARSFNRSAAEMRPVSIEVGIQKFSLGSVLVSFGDTRVICAANIEEKVPGWMTGRGQGWLTAEYSMLPGSSQQRTQRDAGKGTNGRSQEIQRLIGRALRGVTDLKALGERTLSIDCDVLQADGGTRTAAITGAFVALSLAIKKLMTDGKLTESPLLSPVAAASAGIVNGQAVLDLCYTEDVAAAVDMNVVMNANGEFIELQGNGEEATFTEAQLAALLALGKTGIRRLVELQQSALL